MLYARHVAWLQHQPGAGKQGKDEPPPPSRYDTLLAKGGKPVLPPVEARHLIDYLGQLGWCWPTGMSITALPASEIAAWSALSQTPLDPWEFEALRSASRAYVAQSQNDTPSPPYEEQAQHQPSVAADFKKLAARLNAKT